MTPQIHYTISTPEPASHRFVVRIDIAQPSSAGQRLSLPAWIPGSYLVRDFARHVGRVSARDERGAVAVTKLDKSTWRCASSSGTLSIEYDVLGWDLSVRGAHLDATHGFFNGANLCLAVEGQTDNPVRVTLVRPPLAGEPWRVATTLTPDGAEPWGFGDFVAQDYDELLDHPVEMGHFDVIDCDVGGVPHRVVLSGRHHCDRERLASDVERICAQQIALFGELPSMPEYLFLTRVLGEGYGGLEHRSSTALMCRRGDLPRHGADPNSHEGYRRFLGLVSHEYFHLWNVKRIKPAAFTPFELAAESYTELLWVFEGITSYYDDLALVRSGVINEENYLKLVSEILTRVVSVPGHRAQTLAESSFDAWTKFYKPNEDTPNSVVSYYAKGALVALLLDLTIRERTADRLSLDDVMRASWETYGKTGHGMPEDGFERLCEKVTGLDLGPFFERYIRGAGELDMRSALASVGVELALPEAPAAPATLGVRFKKDSTIVGTVFRGGAAERAGLAPGDTVVALDHLRVSAANVSELMQAYAAGDQVSLHAFRHDELLALDVTLDAPAKLALQLQPAQQADEDSVSRRARWLHQGESAA